MLIDLYRFLNYRITTDQEIIDSRKVKILFF